MERLQDKNRDIGCAVGGVLLFAVVLVGGNCNNGAKCGADYLNLNNSASNSNTNIGASDFFQ